MHTISRYLSEEIAVQKIYTARFVRVRNKTSSCIDISNPTLADAKRPEGSMLFSPGYLEREGEGKEKENSPKGEGAQSGL